MPRISVVVPVYRSAETLIELHRRLVAALQGVTPAFEILFVDDCGGDDSWTVIAGIARRDSRVRGIRLSRNFGQHAATICGITATTGDWVVTIDDDLEQPPEAIPALYEEAIGGFALVYGVYRTRTHVWWRNIASAMARRIFKLAIPSLNYDYTSFRVVKRTVALALAEFDSPFPFVDGYLSWLTSNYSTVSVDHGARASGRSNYSLRRLLAHTINVFVTFSDLPLKLASWIGIVSFCAGMGWLLVIVLGKLLGGITVSGYASLMASIILFGGIQLLILGIFGEYLGRMNFKSSHKPLFLVAEDTEARQESR